jgi:hypothetical protein
MLLFDQKLTLNSYWHLKGTILDLAVTPTLSQALQKPWDLLRCMSFWEILCTFFDLLQSLELHIYTKIQPIGSDRFSEHKFILISSVLIFFKSGLKYEIYDLMHINLSQANNLIIKLTCNKYSKKSILLCHDTKNSNFKRSKIMEA